MFIAQRLIRSKGMPVANLTGGLKSFSDLTAAVLWARKQRKVYAILSSDGAEYTVRSSRAKGVRYIDNLVRNVVSASGSKY
jgi:hypothetical protein